jgi:hypothetical protein
MGKGKREAIKGFSFSFFYATKKSSTKLDLQDNIIKNFSKKEALKNSQIHLVLYI